VCALRILRSRNLLTLLGSTEHKDEVDPPLPMPARVPTSMPVPAGPRRAAPPRKKSPKNAPAGPLPEPPAEESEVAAVQSASVIDAPHTGIVDDAPLAVEVSQKETSEVAEAIETTHDERVNITTDPERSAPGSEAFDEPVEEHSHQEGVKELVECAVVHAEEESTHTGAEDQAVHAEKPSGAVEPEAEEDDADEEARRQRVAARLAQMGAFNPLTGPAPIPQRSSFDEQSVVTPSKEPLDVEDEVNVDTEEHRETIPPPPASPARQGTVPPIEHDAAEPDVGIDQDDAKVDEDDQAPAHDGES
jgi:myosin tail region-interacting protein MTI1